MASYNYFLKVLLLYSCVLGFFLRAGGDFTDETMLLQKKQKNDIKIEWEHRKRIDDRHLKQLVALDESLKNIVVSLKSDRFYGAYKMQFLSWLAKQDQEDSRIVALSNAFNEVRLAEHIHMIIADEQLLALMLQLAIARQSNEERNEQTIKELTAKIALFNKGSEALVEDTCIECFEVLAPHLIHYSQGIAEEREQAALIIQDFLQKLVVLGRQAALTFHQSLDVFINHVDSDTRQAMYALQSMYSDDEKDPQYQLIQPIVASVQKPAQQLLTDVKELMVMFVDTAQALESCNDGSVDVQKKIESYRFLIQKLKDYHTVCDNVATVVNNIASQSAQKSQRDRKLLYYALQAFDLFSDTFALYKKDCKDPLFKRASKSLFDKEWRASLFLPTMVQGAFFAANMALHYQLMRTEESKKVMSRFVVGDYAGKKREFFNYFKSKIPAINSELKLYPAKAVKVNALYKVCQSTAMHKFQGLTPLFQQLNSLNAYVGGLSCQAFFAKKLIIDALYYYTLHQRFEPINKNTLKGLPHYKEWSNDVLNVMEWGSRVLGSELEYLFYKTLSIGKLDTLEKYTLGIVTPHLVPKLVSIGKDGLFSNQGLKKSFFNKVAVFDHKIFYGSDFHTQFSHIKDDGKLFALYADRELFSYGIGCIAKFIGGHAIKNCSGFLTGAVKRLAGYCLGKSQIEEYEKGERYFKMILTHGLAVLLGGPTSKAHDDCQSLLVYIKEAYPDHVVLAELFLSMVNEGRSTLLGLFGLREIPGKEHEVNKQLLQNLIFKVFVYNPFHIRVMSASDIQMIMKAYDEDPEDTESIADELLDMVQRNAIGKIGGVLCGKLAEWRARTYWNKRGKPFLFR